MGGGDTGGNNRSQRERESRVGAYGREGMIWQKNQIHFSGGLAGWRYKVARNPLGTVPNAPISSTTGKELHSPTLSMLDMHEGQVKREN